MKAVLLNERCSGGVMWFLRVGGGTSDGVGALIGEEAK